MDWNARVKEFWNLVRDGKNYIAGSALPDIVQTRYNLGIWRGYFGQEYAKFDQQYAAMKLAYLSSGEAKSVAQAEMMADADEDISIKRRETKEFLETISLLSHACSSAISVLQAERGHLDNPNT